MSTQATPPPGGHAPSSAGAPSTAGTNPPPPAVKPDEAPISQQNSEFRANWPSWAKQLPQLKFPTPNPTFELIDRTKLRAILKDADPDVVKRIEGDLQFLENELLRLFRDRDYEAALQQNRYRLYQIMYI